MSTLRELRDTLLTISHPESWLVLADDYLTQFEKHRDAFVLPREHKFQAPVLEHYVGDLDGWLSFVRSVRDRIEPRTQEYRDVHEFFSTLETRALQRRNRYLTGIAIDVALQRGLLEDSYEAKQRYIRRCIQHWKKRRTAMLDAVRRASPTGRVSTSHRAELLKEFWAQIEAELHAGEIPPP